MLVLTRKMNEAIVIGENIVVTVIDIRGDKIRLGIEAPKHVSVHRREIYERISLSDTEGQPGPNTSPLPTFDRLILGHGPIIPRRRPGCLAGDGWLDAHQPSN